MKKSLFAFLVIAVVSILGFTHYSHQEQNLSGVSVDLYAAHVLPDPSLTPGALNPDITQATISQTICNPHWTTSTIRPTSSYTTNLKVKQFAQYKYSDTKTGDYEEDHLISLELGGAPSDPNNLWPQAYSNVLNGKNYGAKVKDTVENYLHKQVCSGKMTLKDAQDLIKTNWTSGIQSNLGSTDSQETSDPDDDYSYPHHSPFTSSLLSLGSVKIEES